MKHQNWIKSPENIDGAVLAFKKDFSIGKNITKAVLHVSCLGLYRAKLNGKKVGGQVLTPGLTSYDARVQYQSYDVTDMLSESNTLEIAVGPGWAVGYYGLRTSRKLWGDAVEAVAELELTSADGNVSYVNTDESWTVHTTEITHSDIYRGETVDMTAEQKCLGNAVPAKAFPMVVPFPST